MGCTSILPLIIYPCVLNIRTTHFSAVRRDFHFPAPYAISLYLTHSPQRYWSKIDGIPELTWADPEVTAQGILQAIGARNFWASALVNASIPAPESYYSSPLIRSLETARLTFSNLSLPADRPFKPVVKELLREALGEHTCDRRSRRSVIEKRFPEFEIEEGFTEEDELWVPEVRESNPDMDARLTRFLDDVFGNDDAVFVSLTGHGGSTGAILRAVGHRKFALATGGVMPIMVRAECAGGSTKREKGGPGLKT